MVHMENIGQATERLAQLVGKRIKDAREALGFTQEDVAVALTASGHPTQRVTVTRTESASRPITLKDLAAYSAVLEVPVRYFLMEEGEGDTEWQALDAQQGMLFLVDGMAYRLELELAQMRENLAAMTRFVNSKLSVLDGRDDGEHHEET